MSGAFNVGDVVVCVIGGRQICPHRANFAHAGINLPPLRKPVRITGSYSAVGDKGNLCGCTNLILSDGSVAASFRLRHLPKADHAFTAQMRAIKPARKQVSA